MLYRTRWLTRSGRIAASRIPLLPVSSVAIIAVRVDPTASSTAIMSSIDSSQVGTPSNEMLSDAPVPRRSKRISLVKEDRTVRIFRHIGTSQMIST